MHKHIRKKHTQSIFLAMMNYAGMLVSRTHTHIHVYIPQDIFAVMKCSDRLFGKTQH